MLYYLSKKKKSVGLGRCGAAEESGLSQSDTGL